MRLQQGIWSVSHGWEARADWTGNPKASLVLVFGSRELLGRPEPFQEVRRLFPGAQIAGCSTAGEICAARVSDNVLMFTAIEFEHSQIRLVDTQLESGSGSREAGRRLAKSLMGPGLVHALVLSDGSHVNGSELVQGLTQELPAEIAVTGGLAGDGPNFGQTLVCVNGNCQGDRIAAIGLYGSRLRVGYGSRGGWEPFGPERIVTRSSGNVLRELDGESALALYERYLGEHAGGLPASALRFPLSVRSSPDETAVVRTILGIDKQQQSMTFAGDIAEGMYARLMRADLERLIDGAGEAARVAREGLHEQPAELAILISCVGRRLVLKQRTEEELEAVRDVLGRPAALAGFYSYGEICPFGPRNRSELHNQTMTVTTFSEAA